MESMIIKSGWILAACVKICSRCVSHRMKQFGLSCDNRSARSFNWRLLSSPETYRVFKPVKPNTVCKTKVDFPIPGSPRSRPKSLSPSLRRGPYLIHHLLNRYGPPLPSLYHAITPDGSYCPPYLGTGRFTASSFVTISST